ncbi:hypothetical protein HO133_009629 [Letharia lupina]|uniref:Uncharacterized protein n=1 Tax=Letharia lupina TaxID=560253 RepID=A0A8H6CLD0_9LECA|nr:uncharacterized protein HO133_009629 [Letharia lupina]KAF6225629.1 hypothetical protein HO133_009629 [Letharia lupina]
MTQPFDIYIISSNSQIIRDFTAEQNHAFTNILLPALQVVLRQTIDKHFDPLQPQQKQSIIAPKPAQQEQEQKYRPLQQAKMEKTAEKSTKKITETVSSSSDTTGLLSTVSHQPTQSATQPEHSVKQEEKPLQAITENTAKKSSDNKATIIKKTAQLSKIPRYILSTIPRQIATQQAENDTTIWPAISACLGNITLVWHITARSKQEKDLLRRLQPNYYDQQAKATHISLTSHRIAIRSMRKMRRRIRSITASSNDTF